MPNSVSSEVLASTEAIIEDQLHLLKSVEDSWQPSDFLPDLSREDWPDKVRELRGRAQALPDEVLVVLIGNLITEEALPSYQTWLNRFDGLRDETGASQNPWAVWTRGWTAEEKRHGELLSRYLYLSGRADMRSVEVTVQYLIRNGFDLKSGRDPFKSLVYAAFQERATKIAHANVGRAAQEHGEDLLMRICGAIAGDEARHEEVYKRIFAGLIRMDASRAVIAFAAMMRQRIAMPARLMSDGSGSDTFARFAMIAQRIGIYTARDYAEIIGYLVQYWKIASLSLSGEAAAAQEYLCNLEAQYLNRARRVQEVVLQSSEESFNWLFGRSA